MIYSGMFQQTAFIDKPFLTAITLVLVNFIVITIMDDHFMRVDISVRAEGALDQIICMNFEV